MPWTPSKTIPTSPTRPADSRREAGCEPPTIVLKMLRKQCCSFMARNGFSWRFDSAGERVSEDPGSLVSRFEQFDAENPLLYDTMVRLARQRAVQNGGHKLSVRTLLAAAKWEMATLTGGVEIQCNNGFLAFYARKIMRQEPDLSGLFEVRSSEADEWVPKQTVQRTVQAEPRNVKALDLGSAPVLDAEQARKLTDRIKVNAEALWELIVHAYHGRAWTALGYESWDTYCVTEFGTSRLKVPREERTEIVTSLKESGLSDRAIESATGISRSTLIRDRQSGGVNDTTSEPAAEVVEDALAEEPVAVEEPVDAEVVEDVPAEPVAPEPKPEPKTVTGIDGKNYKAKGQKTTPRTPITTVASKLAMDLDKATNRVKTMAGDDRLAQNRDKVATHLRYYLIQMIEACQELDRHINP